MKNNISFLLLSALVFLFASLILAGCSYGFEEKDYRVYGPVHTSYSPYPTESFIPQYTFDHDLKRSMRESEDTQLKRLRRDTEDIKDEVEKINERAED